MYFKHSKFIYTLILISYIFSNIASAKLSGEDFSISVYTGEASEDVQEIIQSQEFVPLHENPPRKDEHSWIKIKWDKKQVTNEQFLLNNDFDVNQYQVYVSVKNDEVIAKYQSSKAQFFDANRIKHFRFVMDVSNADYVLVQTCCNTKYSQYFYLMSKSEVGDDYHAQSLGYAVAYSLITLMVLYNFFIWVYLREKPYFWYCFYLGSGLVGLISLSGIGRLLLWPETQNLLVIYFNESAWFSISSVLFVVHFLDRKRFSKRTLRIAGIAVITCITASVISIISYLFEFNLILDIINKHLVAVQGLAWIGFMVNSYIIIRSMLAGDPKAKIVLFSYTIVDIGMIVITLRNSYMLPDNFWTTYAMEIAFIVEAVILSLVLAQNVQHLRQEKNQLQKQFSWRLIETQEKEKKQLGSVLHDEFTHKLLLLKNDIDSQRDNHSDQGMRVLEILDDMRKLSHTFHPHILSDLGLQPALHDMVESINQRTGLEISLAIVDVSLDETQQLLLYRIVQESLNNVLKHADANECFISLRYIDIKQLLLSIVDDGMGFNVRKQTLGLGLKTLQERTDMLSGKLTITSSSDGTNINIQFPIG